MRLLQRISRRCLLRRLLRNSKLRGRLRSLPLNDLLATGVLLLLLSACVSAPDVWVCTSLGDSSGWCTQTVSAGSVNVDATHKLNGESWPDLLNASVIVPTASWVVIKKFIENTCHQSGNCGSGVGDWATTLQSIDTHVASAATRVKVMKRLKEQTDDLD